MLSSTRALALLSALVFTVGCSGQPSQAPPPAAPPQQPAAKAGPSPAVAEYMKEHFTKVAAVRDAVVLDDPKAAQEAANWIIEQQPVEGLPGEWKPHVEAIKAAAKDALNATNVNQAGSAVGSMARACGECHQALGAKLTPAPVGPVPTDLSGVPAQMKRHNWAIDQMWIGLVYPAEDAWRRGADSLAFAALKPEELSKDQALGRKVSALAIQVHTLGADGAKAEGAAARAEVYGKLIATCTECHRQLRKPVTPGIKG
jgi:cytochrome c553